MTELPKVADPAAALAAALEREFLIYRDEEAGTDVDADAASLLAALAEQGWTLVPTAEVVAGWWPVDQELSAVTAFLDRFGLANTSGPRHEQRRAMLAQARAVLGRALAATDVAPDTEREDRM